ncbi:hypothetical protein DPMN_157064 [Dreissena polymorpha]|uniref:Uncharacterized protein n=1 Tax=Dreissena polymorpha TaxID=45954 RepID=A0A9D4EHE9_DREPO|nr:hypothetical protein DPMN_157064 [Dreissena polymorpha]
MPSFLVQHVRYKCRRTESDVADFMEQYCTKTHHLGIIGRPRPSLETGLRAFGTSCSPSREFS